MQKVLICLLALGLSGAAQGLRFWGAWEATVELLPKLRIYESELVLNCSLAQDWRIESESKIYSDGLLRYQNFYLSGSLGGFRVWGKIYFHAQEVRYQKAWLNAEIALLGGTFRSSFNHWASAEDYSDYDRDTFGPWPCLEVVSWQDAWKFIGREVYVTGPVAGGFRFASGAVAIYLGENWPSPERFQIYIPPANVSTFEAVFGSA
ncbi:MAG: hypothetical protein NZ651_07240, partial [Candidatus Bipolaricaulota bacterium]|nr:hypothetical protein [Candidatus Bipolaricaulota bacterium]MDW8127547.1 hypothetical protein [Candidatus Bipolaricaulota bacterium]